VSVFFAASMLIAMTAGPDNLFILALAGQRGKIVGLIGSMGLSTGILFHALAVALGGAALFIASALAFLSQFTNPPFGPLLAQCLVLGALFALSTLLVFGAISLLGCWRGMQVRSLRNQNKFLTGLQVLFFWAWPSNLSIPNINAR
jgi:threonine/homoserine/homoserine lactone efflux protein